MPGSGERRRDRCPAFPGAVRRGKQESEVSAGERLVLKLVWMMNSRPGFASRLFLILVFVCAISLGSAVGQPRSTFARHEYGGGRLIVERAPNFGWDLAVRLWIDGRAVANIVQSRRYDGFVPAGHHVLTVLAVPNSGFRHPTSTRLSVQPGRTYVFTAVWESDRVVLRRSTSEGKNRF